MGVGSDVLPDSAGISEISFSSPPASNNKTDHFDISESLEATTAPAEPPPIIIKSYSGKSCRHKIQNVSQM